MSAQSRRASHAEARGAAILGTTQIGAKAKGKSVADVEPVRLADGRLLQPEIKSRKGHPRFLSGALAQASRYCPEAVPVVLLFARGDRKALVCLDAHVFAELLGLRDPSAAAQLALALAVPK